MTVVGNQAGSSSVLETTIFFTALILLAKITRLSWPHRGESFECPAAEEQGVSGHQLVDLVLVAVRAPVELKRPAAPTEVLGAAGVFHDTVQRDEFGDNDSAHVHLNCPRPMRVRRV
jgi:hypothetical protein